MENNLTIYQGKGEHLIYDKYCPHCGFEFNKPLIKNLDKCPRCDHPIRPGISLRREGGEKLLRKIGRLFRKIGSYLINLSERDLH